MKTLLIALLAALQLAAAQPVLASDFPNRTLRLVTGFAAGGPSDSIARAIAQEMARELNQQVVVENRAGAAGQIGLDAVVQSAPDGYTLGLLSNSTTTALHFANRPLEIGTRYVALAQFVATRLILIVNPKVIDVKDLAGFVEHARRNPGMTYTTSGHGGPGHLGMAMFAREKGLQMTHVAYRGSAPAMVDVVAGLVGAKVVDASTAMPFVTSGAVRPIVTVSTVRAPALPDLSTAIEQGETAFQIDSTMSLVVPAGTPEPVVARLRDVLRRATHGEGFRTHSQRQGNAIAWLDAPAYTEWLKRDFERWGRAIREAGVSAPTN